MLVRQGDVQSLSMGKQNGGSRKIQEPWLVRRGFSPVFSALFEKEFRYLLRTSQGRYAFVWPIFIAILLRIFSTQSDSNREVFEIFESYRLLPFVGFYFFFLLPFFVDLFGYDQKGVRLYYLAPVSFRMILIAKNLAVMALGILCFMEFLLLSPLAFGHLSVLACIYALAALMIGFPLIFTSGNFISCYFPRPLKPNTLRGNNPPHAAVVLGMLSIGVTSLPTIAIVLLTEAVHPLIGVGAMVMLLGLSVGIYGVSLNVAARRYEQRGEKMMAILTQTEKAG